MRRFKGKEDESAVILGGVFPHSDIVLSTPIGFSPKGGSGVFFEGDLEQLEKLHRPLLKLLKVDINEPLFGE